MFAIGILKKPQLTITCQEGGGMSYNSDNQLAELSGLLQILKRVFAPGVP